MEGRIIRSDEISKVQIAEDIDSDELEYMLNPSQYVNILWALLAIGLTFLSFRFDITYWIPGVFWFIWICKWIIIGCWDFQLHEKTIAERKGVFSVYTREIHYHRIKSVRFEEPFLLRIFGLSNIVMVTSDPLIPILRIYAIEDGLYWRDEIKKRTSKWRRSNGITDHDISQLM